jgi:putative PIN family toxin of toxin-antitoxin system
MTEPSGILPSRAVVDPNVFVSALVSKPGSPPLAVAQAVSTGTMILVACPHLLEELAEVLLRDKFRRYVSLAHVDLLVAALELRAEMRPDPASVPQVCPDPEDDYLFALAADAEVKLIVSGDRGVRGATLPGLNVLTPREMVDKLEELVGNPHPWGPTFLAARADEALLIAQLRGDDKVLTVAAYFRSALEGRRWRRDLPLLATPDALPSFRRYRRVLIRLLNARGMANFVDYPEPDVAIVKMPEDPGSTIRTTGEALVNIVPVKLRRRPDLPHMSETGGWRVDQVGDPSREDPGYEPPLST